MDKSVTIELPVAELNVVMMALANRPFGEVAELITKIRQQAENQLAPPAPAPAE
jgi:hypothetical protein